MMSVTITLTDEQALVLRMYIEMTAYVRKGQIETCENLAREKGADGIPIYPKMDVNAEFWRMIDQTMEQVNEVLKGATLSGC